VLLVVIFGALMCWLVLTRHLVFKVLASCLAFIPAVVFGIAAVNKYYDYYQNWASAIADFSSQSEQAGLLGASSIPAADVATVLRGAVYTKAAERGGFTFQVRVYGAASHLTRNIYIYLPPQYFQPAYRGHRFGVIELIHGFPGEPQDWISVLDVTATLRSLISRGLAKPVVLVMPDANGAQKVSLQCLNQVSGPQDATFIARDIPDFVARSLRVWPPGRAWGIAGYSEGGFCAANLGLRFSDSYGFAGVLSGYFKPMQNQLDHPSRLVSPFGADKALRAENTPTEELLSLPAGALIPQFWIGAGSGNPADVRAADVFRQLVGLRQPAVVFKVLPGAGHTMFTWRLLVPPMLEWMTPRLARNASLAGEQTELERVDLSQGHRVPRPFHP
jgi:enterochelin esterase-like enzyme